MMLSRNYTEAIKWTFRNTQCEVIMTCLIGTDSKDQEIYQYLYNNRKRIDRATGDDIYFIYPVESSLIDGTKNQVLLRDEEAFPFNHLHKEDRHILSDGILDAIYEECPKLFNFDHHKLPGLILIRKTGDYFPQLVPIKSVKDIDLYIDAFGIVTSYKRDHSTYLEKINSSKDNVKEVFEEKLDILNHDMSERFSQLEVSRETLLENITSLLRNNNVDKADIEHFHRTQNTKKALSILRHKYANLQQSTELNDLARAIRQLQQRDTLQEEIDELQSRIKTAVSEKDIAEWKQKLSDAFSLSAYKLSRILLSTEAAERVLSMSVFPCRDLQKAYFNIIQDINQRSLEIKNRLNDISEKLDSIGYDIFISCKSEDYKSAHELHEFLLNNGHRPFIADIALREVGTDRYGDLIRQVIDRCQHLIVFATNIEYIKTEYVKHEWTLFYDEVMAGRKQGRLFAVLPTLNCMPELPIEFRNTQCFEISSFKETILDFLKENL